MNVGRKAYGLAEESVQEWISHRIHNANDAQDVIDQPHCSICRHKIVQFIQQEYPSWQFKDDKYTHEDENDFKHSHLSSLSFIAMVGFQYCHRARFGTRCVFTARAVISCT